MWPRRLTKLRMCEAMPPPAAAVGEPPDVSATGASSPASSLAESLFLLRLSRSESFISAASYCNNNLDLVLRGQSGVFVRVARHDVSVALDRNTFAGIAQSLDQLGDRARLGQRVRCAIKKDF